MDQYRTLYLDENFFTTGRTDIMNDQQEKVGYIHIKSVLSPIVEVYDHRDRLQLYGSFGLLSNRWVVCDTSRQVLGKLRNRYFWQPGKFRYRYRNLQNKKNYYIQPPETAMACRILDEQGETAAYFGENSHIFSKKVYEVHIYDADLRICELLIVLTGACMTQKQEKSSISSL
ncbi:MAG: hypothetical protein H0Z33_14220 [Bacillaceae bacterium]|nr:hypothetical protein [Bacillaceae bacterium]